MFQKSVYYILMARKPLRLITCKRRQLHKMELPKFYSHRDGDRIHVVTAGTSILGRRTTDSLILLKCILSAIVWLRMEASNLFW